MLGRVDTEKHKHRNSQTQNPAFAFGCVAFGCVWIHSAFAAFAFGCVLRLGALRLPAFGSGSAFAAFIHSAFGPSPAPFCVWHDPAFAFGCVCVCCVCGILRLVAFGWFSTALAGRLVGWPCSPRQPDCYDVDKQELMSEIALRVMLGSASLESADSGPYLPHATALRTY